MLEVTTGKVMTSFLYPKYAPMNTRGTEIPNLRGGRGGGACERVSGEMVGVTGGMEGGCDVPERQELEHL
jgi:hypothetical protein